MLANVSHELRAPLNVILGYTGAALAQPEQSQSTAPAELRGDLGHIYHSAEHLMRLINDLLDLSRAEIGELELFPETVSVHLLLEEVFRGLAVSGLARPGVMWNCDFRSTCRFSRPIQCGCAGYCSTCSAMRRSSRTAGGDALSADVRPPYVHLAVTDTGPGIPESEREQIFLPFVSLERPNSRSHGIGLGLSITRRLVALHGGYLSVESRLGEGSAFHVYLPLPSLSGSAGSTTPQAHPAILLVSGGKAIPNSVLELATRLDAVVWPVRPEDNLEDILARGWPTMLAWDHSRAAPGDWGLIERLRSHPYLARLPFLFFGSGGAGSAHGLPGATNVLLKASGSKMLLEAIRALRSPGAPGFALIVDDDAEARTLYRRLLAEALPGQSIREAENAPGRAGMPGRRSARVGHPGSGHARGRRIRCPGEDPG